MLHGSPLHDCGVTDVLVPRVRSVAGPSPHAFRPGGESRRRLASRDGARLLAALKKKRPDLSAFGMGGERLEAEGLDRVVGSEELSVVGVFEVFEKLPALSKALSRMSDAARGRRPDAAILIDFPDFHGLLARRLHRARVPLLYYVSPQVWAWRAGRARSIARLARRIVTLFP